jgi:hypothetical protein
MKNFTISDCNRRKTNIRQVFQIITWYTASETVLMVIHQHIMTNVVTSSLENVFHSFINDYTALCWALASSVS